MNKPTEAESKEYEELKKKCLLNNKELKGYLEYRVGDTAIKTGERISIAAVDKTLKIAEPEIRRECYQDIGELLCSVVGNAMLEDMEYGKKLGESLKEIVKYCQQQAGIIP